MTDTSEGTNPSPEKARRQMQARKRTDDEASDLTEGAAAAQRAAAGMGTEDAEPAAWLFGDSLSEQHSG